MNREKLMARLAEITSQLSQLKDKAALEQADIDTMSSLSTEIETIQNTLSVLDKADAAVVASNKGAGRQTDPAPIANSKTPRVDIIKDAKDRFGGFNNNAEFFSAVRDLAFNQIHKNFQNAHYEKMSEDGGILVPQEIGTAIQSAMQSEVSLLARTSQILVSGNNLTLPVDHNQPWNSGIQARWLKEGGEFTLSKAKLDSANWRLNKLGALVRITEELRQDATAMVSYIQNNAPKAMVHATNDSILSGSGVGEMTGIIESPFTVVVPKEASQTTGTIVTANILKMYTRMLAASRPNSVWLVTAEAEATLMTLTDGDGRYIYLTPTGHLAQSPYGLLLGRPVIPMMSGLPVQGIKGDIIFADFSYYTSIMKAGIRQDVSTHVYFDRDIVAYKFVQRLDGKTPFNKPVKAQNGTYTQSAFVVLETRA